MHCNTGMQSATPDMFFACSLQLVAALSHRAHRVWPLGKASLLKMPPVRMNPSNYIYSADVATARTHRQLVLLSEVL